MNTCITDFRNIEIEIDDRIAYAVRKGSEMWMNTGIVVEVFDTGALTVDVGDNTFRHLVRSDRVAVLDRTA